MLIFLASTEANSAKFQLKLPTGAELGKSQNIWNQIVQLLFSPSYFLQFLSIVITRLADHIPEPGERDVLLLVLFVLR